jgi:transcriptional regulator with XRE-family HTH domain
MDNGKQSDSAPNSLGERLRQKRKEMGWTQEQLAARAGTTQAVIQKIENGKSLRPRKIDKIAEPLGVLPAWLMFGDERYDDIDAEAMEILVAWQKLDPVSRAHFKRQLLGKILCGV